MTTRPSHCFIQAPQSLSTVQEIIKPSFTRHLATLKITHTRCTKTAKNGSRSKVLGQIPKKTGITKKIVQFIISTLNIFLKSTLFYDHSSIIKPSWKILQSLFHCHFAMLIWNRNSRHDLEFKTNPRIYTVPKCLYLGKRTNITYIVPFTAQLKSFHMSLY